MRLFSKKFLLLGMVVVLLAVIPIAVYFLQQEQDTRSSAQATTTLCFSLPSSNGTCLTQPVSAKVGETTTLDIIMDPHDNHVSYVKLHVTFDPVMLATTGAGLVANAVVLPNVIEEATYTPEGNATFLVSVGGDVSNTILAKTKIATISFKPLQTTTTTQVLFGNQTHISSVNTQTDSPTENVLDRTTPAEIQIAAASGVTPTTTITPTPGIGGTQNTAPVCNSFTTDKEATGAAPLALTFTATGSDSDGTINKATFNFGDGPVQDVTEGSGIDTASANLELLHTYTTTGTYTASVIFTDDEGGISVVGSCTKQVSVSSGGTGGAAGGTGGTGTGGTGTNQTAATSPIPTTTPTIESPGPASTIFNIGAVATLLSIVGAVLFFAL